MTLKAWKFVIPPDQWRDHPSGDSFKGCVAIQLAETAEEAKQQLATRAKEEGDDARWLDLATVQSIDLVPGARLAWVLF